MTYLFHDLDDLAQPSVVDLVVVGIYKRPEVVRHVLRSVLTCDVLWCISAKKVTRRKNRYSRLGRVP